MVDRLRVGVITSPHGIKGEVNVFPTTDDARRYDNLEKVYIDLGKEMKKCEIEGVKYFKNMVILKFKGIDDRNIVEGYRSKDLYIDREDAVPLAEGEHFICDLIGMDVVTDEGIMLGKLKDVITTAANDVYVVDLGNGKEVLIPYIKQCVLNIDMEAGKILVHLLPGLM